MPAKLTIEKVRKEFKDKGFELITDTYINSRQLFRFKCSCGNESQMRLDHLRQGVKCAYCSGNKKLTIEHVRKELLKEGYTLDSTTYTNSATKFNYTCPKGHKGSINWNNWGIGHRCSVCFGTSKYSTDYIKENLAKEGYQLIDKEYLGNKYKLTLICPNKHEYKVSWDNWKSKGSRCPKCNEIGISKPEKEIQDFLNSFDISFRTNDRLLIKPYELDIVIPSKKIAIEYCGLYWHSEILGKDRKYHSLKLDKCLERGYKLITIFEDEWLSKTEIVKNRLRNLLFDYNNLTTVYARNCVVKEISSKVAKEFCIDNHIQGYAISNTRLGLFLKDELVSVMTFAKPSLSKGQKISKEYVWELSRFCSKSGFRVIGGASKLLKYFERNYDWSEIFSYADRRWSDGNLYDKLGFDYINTTKPNYWYFKNNTKRYHRFSLRKTKEDIKEMTEWEIRKSQNWNRIWDCGNLKFNKTKERFA